MNKKQIQIVVAIVIVIVLAGIWYFTKSEPASGEPIKIGVVYSLTGSGSFWAEYGKNALDLAVEEVNEDGGINGRPLELVYEDSQTNPTKGVSAYQKLTEVDKVDVVIGDVWAFLVNPLVPLSQQKKVVTISPTVMDASVEGESEYFFTLGHTFDSIQIATETFLDLHPDAKSIAIICANNSWGVAYTNVYKSVIESKERVLIEEVCTPEIDPNYRTEALKIKAANPDIILINGIADRAVKALRDIGVDSVILADSNLIDGFENRKSIELSYLDNVYVIDWRPNENFSLKYKEKFGNVPIMEAQNSYEVIRSIVRGYENNPDNLLEGLKTVKYSSVDEDGEIDFTDGDNIRPNKGVAKLYRVEGVGNYIEVK